MAEIITMPKLSDTMTDGVVSKWYKNVGESIKEGDILADIETDKATQEFESEFNGVLLHIGAKVGEAVSVDSLIAIIGKKNEDITLLIPSENKINTEEKPEANRAEETISEVIALPLKDLPKDVFVITMPRLSDTMTEGKVQKWYKSIGNAVKEGEILADIETDKAIQEFESEYNGTLLFIGAKEGENLAVDENLAIIGKAGTDISSILNQKNKVTETDTNVEREQINKHTDENLIILTNQNTSNVRISISPLAKKIALEKKIDFSKINGSGDGGRIIAKDIENYKATTSLNFGANAVNNLQDSSTEIPLNTIKKITAKRLSESKFTAPHYYLNMEINMDNIIVLREGINQSIFPEKISFNDLLIKFVAVSVKKHLEVNVSWAEDKIIQHNFVNIGVAVATKDGLVVPVINHADLKSFTDISKEMKDKALRGKEKKLKLEEISGSTFTISNLGAFGIESFTSIINQPNACILSIGAIIQKPIVKNNQIIIGNTLKLTLACDHRTVDGAVGSSFLQTLKRLLENPALLLI